MGQIRSRSSETRIPLVPVTVIKPLNLAGNTEPDRARGDPPPIGWIHLRLSLVRTINVIELKFFLSKINFY